MKKYVGGREARNRVESPEKKKMQELCSNYAGLLGGLDEKCLPPSHASHIGKFEKHLRNVQHFVTPWEACLPRIVS